MRINFDTYSMSDYKKFLNLKTVPTYTWKGTTAIVPDEYASLFNSDSDSYSEYDYTPSEFLFDYQKDISALAIAKKKFAVFAQPGLGKTFIMWEFARHVVSKLKEGESVLVLSPLMIIRQSINEYESRYNDIPVEQVSASNFQTWMNSPTSKIGIANYECVREDVKIGNVKCIICDESSIFKDASGNWGNRIIELGKGLEWKLSLTGTPAPNDRIEYANQALFLDKFRTVNEYLATYFVNRGETSNRWELKPHAVNAFYRDLSDWCIFLENPGTYGWKDNCNTLPPIISHIHHIELTDEQRNIYQQTSGNMFVSNIGGIGSRSKMAQLAKGNHNGKKIDTNKNQFILDLVNSWIDSESTIIWCQHNKEQEDISSLFPGCANITGSTDYELRIKYIEDFQSGRVKVLVSKPKILGQGLNLQIATRQVFSGLSDSFEGYHQAVKRSNRIGSTIPLNVHIPVTELEYPMIANVLEKAHRVQLDSEEQERVFKEKTDLLGFSYINKRYC